MANDLLRSHSVFEHQLPTSLDFNKSVGIHYKQGKLSVWLHSHEKGDRWVYKAFYDITGDYGHYFDAPYSFSDCKKAKAHAIAVGEQIEAYLEAALPRLRYPASLAPVTKCEGYFFDQFKTDMRIIAWYFLNISQVSDDVTFIAPIFERLGVSSLRFNALWLGVQITLSQVTPRIDYNILNLTYYMYGLGYGLTASEIRNLANNFPF